jgi:hypothetical protein
MRQKINLIRDLLDDLVYMQNKIEYIENEDIKLDYLDDMESTLIDIRKITDEMSILLTNK